VAANIDEQWHMPFQDRELCQKYFDRSGKDISVRETDWMCPSCYKLSTTPPPPTVPPHIKYVTQCVQKDLQQLNECGYVLRRTLVREFKDRLHNAKVTLNLDIPNKEIIQSYESMLVFEMSKNKNIQTINNDSGNKIIGTMFYHQEKLCSKVANDVYTLLYDKEIVTRNSSVNPKLINIQDIANMIDIQTKLFSEAESAYDYRKLFDDMESAQNKSEQGDSYFLGQFLHSPLADFLEKILNVTDKKNTHNTHKAQLKIQMVIGILCNVKSQKCTFVQNMVGLSLFAGGVKDKICDLLAMFGLTTTSRTVRSLIQTWSKKRDVLSELDKGSFWRFSFDNLNFLRKFANTFKLGCKVTGRMLNLLTGQVSHTFTSPVTENNINSNDHHDIHESGNVTVSLDDFFVKEGTQEETMWEKYLLGIYSVAIDRKDKHTSRTPFETSFFRGHAVPPTQFHPT
jgi:hypothetical protein